MSRRLTAGASHSQQVSVREVDSVESLPAARMPRRYCREVAVRASEVSESAVRQRLRELVAAGRLPAITPVEIAAGYGHGRVCVACDRPVTNHQMEYEVGDAGEERRLSFHSACYLLWQSECARGRQA